MSGKLRFVERFSRPRVENDGNWDLKITLPKSSDLETSANCWMVRKSHLACAKPCTEMVTSWQPVLLCTCKSPNLKEYRSVVIWGVQGIPIWCYSVCTSMRWRLWTIIPSPSMQSFLPLCRRLAWEVPYGPAVSRSLLPALLTFPWVPLASSFPRGPAAPMGVPGLQSPGNWLRAEETLPWAFFIQRHWNHSERHHAVKTR